jgi:hypothetical protein
MFIFTEVPYYHITKEYICMASPPRTKAALQRRVEIFLSNAVADDIQAIISKGGCNLAFLSEGQTLLQAWLDAKLTAAQLNGKQKKATKAQWDAHDLANLEMIWLAGTVQDAFKGNEPLLTSLGLWKAPKSGPAQPTTTTATTTDTNNTEAAESTETPPVDSDAATTEADTPKKRSGPKGQTSLAANVARWQQLCRGVLALEDDQLAALAKVGWGMEHLQEALAIVNAVAQADNDQQVAIKIYREGSAHSKRGKTAIETWHRQAKRMAKNAIIKYDPDNKDHWFTQLGL